MLCTAENCRILKHTLPLIYKKKIEWEDCGSKMWYKWKVLEAKTSRPIIFLTTTALTRQSQLSIYNIALILFCIRHIYFAKLKLLLKLTNHIHEYNEN